MITSAMLDAPMYGVAEAAAYLSLPAATLHSWTRPARRVDPYGNRQKPLIKLGQTNPPQLSFANLLEAHILSALRKHNIPMQRIRPAVDYLRRHSHELDLSAHPLIGIEFKTDGKNLFVDRVGQLINVSTGGQTALREVLDAYLTRIEYEGVLPVRLFPFSRPQASAAQPKVVVISPTIAFGRPVIAGSGIPVEEISGRHKAGESIRELAHDYERTAEEIEEAIRFREAA